MLWQISEKWTQVRWPIRSYYFQILLWNFNSTVSFCWKKCNIRCFMLRYIKFEMYVHCSSCEYSMRMYAVVFTLKNDYICYCVLLLHMKIPDHCIRYEGVWCAEVVVFHFQRQHKWGACSFLRCCLYTKIYNPPFCSHNRTELGSGPQGTQRSLPLKKTFHLTLIFFPGGPK